MAMGLTTQPLVSLISYVVVDETDKAFKSTLQTGRPHSDQETGQIVPYPTIRPPRATGVS